MPTFPNDHPLSLPMQTIVAAGLLRVSELLVGRVQRWPRRLAHAAGAVS